MEFNIPKCKIMQIATYYNESNFTYEMCTISLNTVTEHEYLGICLHHKLFWSPHVDWLLKRHTKILFVFDTQTQVEACCSELIII